MKKDRHKTMVIFRVFPEGDVIALFPNDKGGELINSYMHVGQHGMVLPSLVNELRKATPAEYRDLKKELEGIGYNLVVVEGKWIPPRKNPVGDTYNSFDRFSKAWRTYRVYFVHPNGDAVMQDMFNDDPEDDGMMYLTKAEFTEGVKSGIIRKVRPSKMNPASAPGNETDARELELFIESDADLYRQQYSPIIINLMRKRKRGIFDPEKAVKLFMYLVENGAKKYNKEFSVGEGVGGFNKNTRLMVARSLTEKFIEEADIGNYDDMLKRAS